MDYTVNWSLRVERLEYLKDSMPLKYSFPDGQVRSQEELHYRRTRRPEANYLGGVCGSGRHLALGLVQRTEGEPKEAIQDK